jgi:hypothetical protein
VLNRDGGNAWGGGEGVMAGDSEQSGGGAGSGSSPDDMLIDHWSNRAQWSNADQRSNRDQ